MNTPGSSYRQETISVLKRIYYFIAIAAIGVALVNLSLGNYMVSIVIMALPVTILCAILLLNRGIVQVTILAIVFVSILLITLSVTLGNGIHETGIVAYSTVVIFSALLLTRNMLALIISSILLCISWLIVGEMYGWYPRLPIPDGRMADVVVIGIVTILTSLVSYSLISINKRSLRAAIQELAHQKNIENQITETINENNALLERIHQRVQNSLLLASNIIDLELMDKSVQNSEFMDLKDHLQIVRLAHEPLYLNKYLPQVEIKDYLRNLKTEAKVDVLIDTKLRLSNQKAVDLGTIVLELVKQDAISRIAITSPDQDILLLNHDAYLSSTIKDKRYFRELLSKTNCNFDERSQQVQMKLT